MAAFRKAIEAGADGIEFDVRLSRDGLPVVIHDDTLRRTASRAERVADLSADELRNVNVGSWFSTARGYTTDDYSAEGVPTLQQLLDEFAAIRKENMVWFRSLSLTEADLDRKGMHPVLGDVTLRNLLATWVVHDLTHIAQVTRVMAKQYKTEMGPWPEFFRILSF